jgi:hypothetical protein
MRQQGNRPGLGSQDEALERVATTAGIEGP